MKESFRSMSYKTQDLLCSFLSDAPVRSLRHRLCLPSSPRAIQTSRKETRKNKPFHFFGYLTQKTITPIRFGHFSFRDRKRKISRTVEDIFKWKKGERVKRLSALNDRNKCIGKDGDTCPVKYQPALPGVCGEPGTGIAT